jgi:hypothetical protein
MKTLVLTIGLVALLSGCHFHGHQVTGSGKRQTVKRDIPAFSSISTEGAFEIEVACQKEPGLELEGDDNILPLVSTEVANNILYIKNTRNYDVDTPIRLSVTAANLEGLSVSGAGKISISGLKNNKFEIDANGAPAITATGETALVDINTNGAGKIDTHKLRASRVVIDSKGVSKVEVYAKDELDVTLAGPSEVIYQGEPKVNKTVHGPGSVQKKESSPV